MIVTTMNTYKHNYNYNHTTIVVTVLKSILCSYLHDVRVLKTCLWLVILMVFRIIPVLLFIVRSDCFFTVVDVVRCILLNSLPCLMITRMTMIPV